MIKIKNKSNELDELVKIVEEFVIYIYASPNDFSKLLVNVTEATIKEHEGYGVYKTFFNTIENNNNKIRKILLDHKRKMLKFPVLKSLPNNSNVTIENFSKDPLRKKVFEECLSTTVLIGSIGNFNTSSKLYDTSSFNTKFYTELFTSTVVKSIFESIISQKALKIHNILLDYLNNGEFVEAEGMLIHNTGENNNCLDMRFDQHKEQMGKFLDNLINKVDKHIQNNPPLKGNSAADDLNEINKYFKNI